MPKDAPMERYKRDISKATILIVCTSRIEEKSL